MPPKPKPRTVSAYIEHESKYRGRSAGVVRALRREWAAKTHVQQTALARRLVEAQNARALTRAQEQIAHAARTRFEAAEPYGEDLTVLFRHQAKIVIDAWKTLESHQKAEKICWERLGKEQEEQGASEKSLLSTEKCWEETESRAAHWACSTYISDMTDLLDHPPVPEFPANRFKMPEEWQSGKLKRAGRKTLLDRQSTGGRVGLRAQNRGNGQWFAQKEMSGGQGRVILWLSVDQNTNQVIDKVARKETFYDNRGWYSARRWDGNVKDENTRTPWEQACHDAMVGGSKNVIPLYEQASRRWIDNQGRKHTMYIAWAPHGDLSDLIKENDETGKDIPEPMIWYVAEVLAKCAMEMEEGHCDLEEENKKPGWRQIVHRDLKPLNILLCEPEWDAYPHYPRPVVADFGLSIRTSTDDPLNPSWVVGTGTSGFRAPETYTWVDRDTGNAIDRNIQILSHTDIYSIGAILYCMVMRRAGLAQPLWLGNGEDEDIAIEGRLDRRHIYTETLRELILDCMRFKPEKRPTPRQLVDRIDDATRNYEDLDGENDENPHTQGMGGQEYGENERQVDAMGHSLITPKDKYRIGLNRIELRAEM